MDWYWNVAIAVGTAALISAAAACFARRKKKRSKRRRSADVEVQTVEEDEIDETALCEIEDPAQRSACWPSCPTSSAPRSPRGSP